MRQLREHLPEAIPPSVPIVSSASYQQHTRTPEPVAVYPLTIQMERQGERLHMAYHLPAGVCHTVERPWQPVQAALIPLQTWLRSPGQGLPEGPEQAGQALFAVLFGTEETWEPILRDLFHQPSPAPRPNPIWSSSVRLRLCTHEPLLLEMPWRLTTWQHYRLAEYGWEFVTTQTVSPSASYTTMAPCNVLLVALHTDVQDESVDPTHLRAIQDVLQQVWPTGQPQGYVHMVQSRQALENALRGRQPHMLYIYGQSQQHSGEVSLPFADGSQIGLRQLVALLHTPYPTLVYLNVTGLHRIEAVSPVLTPALPLVFCNRLPFWQPEVTSLAVLWLRQWLQEACDPVQAWHEVSKSSSTAAATTRGGLFTCSA